MIQGKTNQRGRVSSTYTDLIECFRWHCEARRASCGFGLDHETLSKERFLKENAHTTHTNTTFCHDTNKSWASLAARRAHKGQINKKEIKIALRARGTIGNKTWAARFTVLCFVLHHDGTDSFFFHQRFRHDVSWSACVSLLPSSPFHVLNCTCITVNTHLHVYLHRSPSPTRSTSPTRSLTLFPLLFLSKSSSVSLTLSFSSTFSSCSSFLVFDLWECLSLCLTPLPWVLFS